MNSRLSIFCAGSLALLLSFSLHSNSTAWATETSVQSTAKPDKPNILLIMVDDLNDWIGCLEGHPQAKTPNIDRLAARGTLFTNAHCQAPICNPSRISMLTGTLPSSTGVYFLSPRLRQAKTTKELVTMPQYFAEHGYQTLGAGKIFHVEGKQEFQVYGGGFGGFGPRPKKIISGTEELPMVSPLWDWGVFPKGAEVDSQMPDHKIASWAETKLAEMDDSPFFMAVGFYRPHVPLYAPKKWFDMFPLEGIELPAHLEGDLNDVSKYADDLTWSNVAPRHQWMVEQKQWKKAVQAYLACTTFVDAQVGRVLDALDASGKKDNTIVVFCTDHGFHLGTKTKWGKRSLWDVSTKVPLAIIGPGINAKRTCDQAVGLIDLFPTLVQRAGLADKSGLEGHSLSPLLDGAEKEAGPDEDWPHAAVTCFGEGNTAVRFNGWSYITYKNGAEELYQTRDEDGNPVDAHEFTNLLANPTNPQWRIKADQLRERLPKTNLPMAEGSKNLDARPGSEPDIDKARTFKK